MDASNPAILRKRLIVVAGKGGVGKSTVSAALALSAARRGKRVLLCEIHGTDRMSHFFGVPPVGTRIREIRPNLFAVNVLPHEAMREYAIMKLRFETVYRMVFENRMVSYFLKAFPGLNELVMLGKVWYHTVEEDRRTRRPRFDLVIADTPATGHGLFFLELPDVALNAVPSGAGPLTSEVRKMRELLVDPRRTSLQIVTLPEEMPVKEAMDLRAKVSAMGIPLGYVIVNGVQTPLLNAREEEDLRRLREITGGRFAELGPLDDAARWRLDRLRNQEVHLAQVRRHIPLPRIELPFVHDRELRSSAIEFLAQKLQDQLGEDA
jgi:anion-transporting  ArsA/GET3 family ATPase